MQMRCIKRHCSEHELATGVKCHAVKKRSLVQYFDSYDSVFDHNVRTALFENGCVSKCSYVVNCLTVMFNFVCISPNGPVTLDKVIRVSNAMPSNRVKVQCY